MIVEVQDKDFEKEVILGSKDYLILVDFWAEWCGPCRALTETLKEIDGKYPKLKICKVNVDESPMLANSFGIRGIPTMLIFKDGELKSTKTGLLIKDVLMKWVSEFYDN